MAHLRTGDVSPAEFGEFIGNVIWPAPPLLMAFSPARAFLDRFTPALLEEMGNTEQGRIFSPAGELRWREIGQTFRVVYLGEAPGPESLTDCSAELNGLAPGTRELLLWGERTNTEDEWLEQRVPHRFAFPIEKKEFSRGRAAVVVEDWVDAAGLPRFSRYRELIEVKGGMENAPW
jgi:hypothetical protein